MNLPRCVPLRLTPFRRACFRPSQMRAMKPARPTILPGDQRHDLLARVRRKDDKDRRHADPWRSALPRPLVTDLHLDGPPDRPAGTVTARSRGATRSTSLSLPSWTARRPPRSGLEQRLGLPGVEAPLQISRVDSSTRAFPVSAARRDHDRRRPSGRCRPVEAITGLVGMAGLAPVRPGTLPRSGLRLPW